MPWSLQNIYENKIMEKQTNQCNEPGLGKEKSTKRNDISELALKILNSQEKHYKEHSKLYL